MKCWNGDHDELRRGDFIYRGAAGRGMGVLEAKAVSFSGTGTIEDTVLVDEKDVRITIMAS